MRIQILRWHDKFERKAVAIPTVAEVGRLRDKPFRELFRVLNHLNSYTELSGEKMNANVQKFN